MTREASAVTVGLSLGCVINNIITQCSLDSGQRVTTANYQKSFGSYPWLTDRILYLLYQKKYSLCSCEKESINQTIMSKGKRACQKCVSLYIWSQTHMAFNLLKMSWRYLIPRKHTTSPLVVEDGTKQPGYMLYVALVKARVHNISTWW